MNQTQSKKEDADPEKKIKKKHKNITKNYIEFGRWENNSYKLEIVCEVQRIIKERLDRKK